MPLKGGKKRYGKQEESVMVQEVSDSSVSCIRNIYGLEPYPRSRMKFEYICYHTIILGVASTQMMDSHRFIKV